MKPVLVIPRSMDIEIVKAMLGEYNYEIIYSEPIPELPVEPDKR